VNRGEATEVLAGQLRELQKLAYAEFRSWVIEKKIATPLVKGASGAEYQVEVEAVGDGKQGGDILVLVSVDDVGLASSLRPLCGSFIIAPGGRLDRRVRDEASYTCDSCGEEVVVPIDVSAGSSQQYVEDCPVCCRPNVVHVEVDDGGDVRVWAEGK